MEDTLKRLSDQISSEISKVIMGQKEAVTLLLVSLLARGHVLLEGVPGLGKTLLAKTLAFILRAEFTRIQFTPDMMPADVLGTQVYDLQNRSFRFRKGPIFTEVLLADEINRTPPKTQAALLEAMEERQVSIDGKTVPLSENFFVMATQNPIEQEGTYPLPEAQLDRFLMKIRLDYPAPQEEREILGRYGKSGDPHDLEKANLKRLPEGEWISKLRKQVTEVKVEKDHRLCPKRAGAEPALALPLSRGQPAGRDCASEIQPVPCGHGRPRLHHAGRYQANGFAGATAPRHPEA